MTVGQEPGNRFEVPSEGGPTGDPAASVPPVAASAPPVSASASVPVPPPAVAAEPPPAVAAQPPPGVPAPSGDVPTAGRRRSWPGAAALALVIVLAAALVYQSVQLAEVSGQLDDAIERLDAMAVEQAVGEERHDTLAERTAELERVTGEAFDPVSIADAVLPSVFKVRAGDYTGTAFAVGVPADDGGTNLFTNYHVVEQVWLADDRQVGLERTNQRFDAEIVDVDRSADVAWLHTTSSFTGLVAADDELRAGQPIVSVGAPLGLGDTVTTGVVSNTARELPDGSGPWIQFDAAVEPGNSGGPVINSAGQVVGIATRKAIDFDGIGFAVPITEACELFEICRTS